MKLKVVVGSTNMVKVGAVKRILTPQGYEVEGVDF